MDNHYHLLLETPSSSLSRAIHLINAGYTTWFNKRHDRVGTLFQGRFKALLVERDVYALSASRYVHRNAVCAGLCREPSSYIWSSSRSYAGLQRVPAFLEMRTILSLAGGAAQYREYLGSAEDDEWELEKDTIAGTILGSLSFADRVVALQGTSIFAKEERDVPALRALKQIPLANAIVDTVNMAVSDAKLRRKIALSTAQAWWVVVANSGDDGRPHERVGCFPGRFSTHSPDGNRSQTARPDGGY